MRLGKPVLEAGERTTLMIQINGLQDLEAELPVEIVSHTPELVRLEGGASQPLLIHPTEVQGGGLYQWIGTVVGVAPGRYRLGLSVADSRPWRRLE